MALGFYLSLFNHIPILDKTARFCAKKLAPLLFFIWFACFCGFQECSFEFFLTYFFVHNKL